MKTINFILSLAVVPATIILSGIHLNAQNKTDSLGRKQGYWKKYNQDTLKYEGSFVNDIPVDTFRYYFPDKKIKAITVYSDSGKVAVTLMYYTNGILNASGTYLNRKKDGLWSYFNNDGKKIAEENYNKGKKHGEWKNFYDNGIISELNTYDNDLLHGPWLEFFDDSIVKLKGTYVKGKLQGLFQVYDPNGVIYFSGNYKDDMKDGPWMYFSPKGLGERKLTFKEGVLEKEEIVIITNGKALSYDIMNIAYCYKKDKGVVIRFNSGEEVPNSSTMDDMERILNEYRFFRVSPDFIVSAWAIKNKSTFSSSNPVLVLNPAFTSEIRVVGEQLEGFMHWAGILKAE